MKLHFRLFVIIVTFCAIFLSQLKHVMAAPLSWDWIHQNEGQNTFIKISESNSKVMYASHRMPDSFDILLSIDAGNSWSSIKEGLPSTGQDVNWISSPMEDPGVVGISLWGGGLFLSEEYGKNWRRILNDCCIFPRSIAIDHTNLDVIYGGIGGGSGFAGVFKTSNRGASWGKMTVMGDRNNAQITIDRSNTNRVFADADPDFYRTTNGGLTWDLLPLKHAYSTGTIVDRLHPNIIYTAVYDVDPGVHKSEDNGDSWSWKNNGLSGNIFHLAQDSDGTLYASRVGLGGGVWRSKDGAESWENIADPAWGERNTWGLDVKDGRVYVSVEGLGIFAADAGETAPEPPGPRPVVFIPGLGGSFSYEGLILRQPTTYRDWTMTPIWAPEYYQPFMDALSQAGLPKDQRSFFFGYDFTKSISETGQWLNDFLRDEVAPKNPRKKVNIVAHSMGGLVAKYCVEKVSGCSDRIGKIVTAGTPHTGAVDAYPAWEGGQIKEKDPMKHFFEWLAVHLYGLPQDWQKIDTFHQKVLGIRDILPIFDYIIEKPYVSLSDLAHNPVLESLNPPTRNLKSKLMTLSGNHRQTAEKIKVLPANRIEKRRGLWVDGRPTRYYMSIGDGTVLLSSSRLDGAINKTHDLEHKDYFVKLDPVGDIFSYFDLPAPTSLTAMTFPYSAMMIYTPNPDVKLSFVADEDNRRAITAAESKVLFLKNPSTNARKIKAAGKTGAKFRIEGIFRDQNGLKEFRMIESSINSALPSVFYLFDKEN